MIIHAVSIHTGGGKVLLDHLLLQNTFGPISHLICDERYEVPKNCDKLIKITKIKPNIFFRWKAEFFLKQLSLNFPNEEIFCFSNLPPAFKLKNKVILYLQNALLLPGVPLCTGSVKTGFRILYEKIWLNFFLNNVSEVWVQTEWMKERLISKNKPILIKPFLPDFPAFEKTEIEHDFISITGSAPHKRLLELLNAWDELIAPQPSLLIVMDTPTKIIQDKLEKLKNKNVKVKINISREELFSIYPKCRSLIVTSMVESFCLPIYEAKHFDLQIYAIKEAFNKDIINSTNFLYIRKNKILLDEAINAQITKRYEKL
jgi:hypothetical protein